MEVLYGRDYSEMLAALNLEEVKDEIEEFIKQKQSERTCLYLNLKGKDPDDGMTGIPYNKGYFFLRLIEETVTREKWDTFLKDYFTTNAFKGMTTKKFVGILEEKLGLKSDFYNPWIYTSGLPKNCPTPVSEKLKDVNKVLTEWEKDKNTKDIKAKFQADK